MAADVSYAVVPVIYTGGTSRSIFVEANDISFNVSLNQIATAGLVDFSLFVPLDRIVVSGSASNDGTYQVDTATTNIITVKTTNNLRPVQLNEGTGNTIRISYLTASILETTGPTALFPHTESLFNGGRYSSDEVGIIFP
jgi:hypothetical protein